MKRLWRTTLLGLSLLMCAGAVLALDTAPYTRAAFASAQAAGKPIALHFHADWCPVCRAQDKILDGLKSDSSLPLTVFVVDYDQERKLEKDLGVRVQGTFIVYRGSKETARVSGERDPDRLRTALQSAL